MRFVSKYGRYGVQVRPVIAEAFATGQVRIIQQPIHAIFNIHGITADERDFALTNFVFRGFYQEADEVSVVPFDYRIGVYDTDHAAASEGWDADTKQFVESTLVELCQFGDIALIPVIALAPPWPKYDSYRGAPSQLIRKLVDEGFDLEAVLAYESSDGPQRQPVIDALVDVLSNDSMNQEEEVLA